MDICEGLNDAQKEAVIADGPVLVLAGAGSGKTKTLTHRIAYLIGEKGVWPSQILAVTFTNKAAKEMRERLSALLKQENSRSFMPWMGTFHGICVKLLRMDGAAIGIPSNYVIYDEDDRQGLIKQALKQLSITDKQIKPRAVSSAISQAKNDLISVQEYADTAQMPYQKAIADIYRLYEEKRQEAKALDFDDLLIEVVRLFREHPDVARKWRDHFTHILIDEYQDTNAAQYAIVKKLVNAAKNICVVGDDWQSIYSWRGADFRNILRFEKDFPGTKVVKLEQNYRSTGAILDAAHSVIQKNDQRTDKKLWTALGDGVPVAVHAVQDEAEEAFTVASRIAAQVSNGRSYGDFAVLYRMNAQSYTIERALLQQRIPYHIIGGVRFYDRKEVKDVLAYLKLAYQANDSMSFSRIVNVPARGIGATSLEKFLAWRSTYDGDIITALTQVEECTTLQPRARRLLTAFGEMMRHIQAKIMSDATPFDVLEMILEKTGYRDALQDGTPQAEDRDGNIGSLLSDAQTFATVSEYLEEVALLSSADSSHTDDSVTLMTLHAAKGLEFPVVWMVGMEDGVFPHSRVFDAGKDDLEEERRLCYVGMTRARQELHMSYAGSRMQFGQRSYNPSSRFLADMGHTSSYESSVEFESHLPEQDVIDDFFSDEPALNIGDMVRSPQFGKGRVIDVEGMAVEVEFGVGTKKLNVEYARLEKL